MFRLEFFTENHFKFTPELFSDGIVKKQDTLKPSRLMNLELYIEHLKAYIIYLTL